MAGSPTDKAYLSKHNIPGLVDEFVAALLAEKPGDPLAFAASFYRDLQTIKPCVAGNWKSNGSRKLITDLCAGWNHAKITHDVDIFIAPSSLHCKLLQSTLTHPKFTVAAQNCIVKGGAQTGELSASMVKDAGAAWVILGHSERRAIYGETDEGIAEKVQAALKEEDLLVCPCIGETLKEREAGTTMDVVLRQTAAIVKKILPHQWTRVVLAYEPVWAIGTGKVATPSQAQEVHAGIRAWLRANCGEQVARTTRILYGGSVNPKNAGDLWKERDINGFLVGGASLKPDFIDVINATAAPKP